MRLDWSYYTTSFVICKRSHTCPKGWGTPWQDLRTCCRTHRIFVHHAFSQFRACQYGSHPRFYTWELHNGSFHYIVATSKLSKVWNGIQDIGRYIVSTPAETLFCDFSITHFLPNHHRFYTGALGLILSLERLNVTISKNALHNFWSRNTLNYHFVNTLPITCRKIS